MLAGDASLRIVQRFGRARLLDDVAADEVAELFHPEAEVVEMSRGRRTTHRGHAEIVQWLHRSPTPQSITTEQLAASGDIVTARWRLAMGERQMVVSLDTYVIHEGRIVRMMTSEWGMPERSDPLDSSHVAIDEELPAHRFLTPDRRGSVDTALRNLQQQLVAVTGQADLKASIVITASSITLSLSATRVTDARLRPGLITLGIFVLAALCCAIFSVLPKYRVTGRPPVGQFNPLFFGHAALLDFDEYRAAMHAILGDEEGLYDALLNDLHAQSTYLLRRKFRPLRAAYLCLLVGFIAGGVAQLIAELVR